MIQYVYSTLEVGWDSWLQVPVVNTFKATYFNLTPHLPQYLAFRAFIYSFAYTFSGIAHCTVLFFHFCQVILSGLWASSYVTMCYAFSMSTHALFPIYPHAKDEVLLNGHLGHVTLNRSCDPQ